MKQLTKHILKAALALSLIINTIGCAEDESDAELATLTLNGADSSGGASSLVTTASSLKLKVYAAWVSQYGDCSDPVQVFADANPSYQEFAGGINIGSGEIALGTYNCVIMIMSDYIKYTPTNNDGAQCVAGTEYTSDVCSDGSPSDLDFPDGTSTTCGNGEGLVPLYISTWAGSTDGDDGSNPFKAPTSDGDALLGFNLGAALEVAGNTSNTFVVDVTDKVDGSGGSCEMNPPTFSFE